MSQKSQIQGQVFVFLLALAIVAAVLLLGYKGVKMIMDQMHKAELEKFSNAIVKDVEKYQDSGSYSGKIRYNTPSLIRFVCFLEPGSYNPSNEICDSGQATYQPLACDAWQDSTTSLLSIPPEISDLKIDNLAVDAGAFCLNVQRGYFDVIYEGDGEKTHVKKA